MQKPYLSVVFAGRNDNYGGDFNQRLQNMLTWNMGLLEERKIPSEMVLVNYNPLPNQPSLAETLDWGSGRSYVRVRIITVPEEAHRRLVNPQVRKTVPLFEFPAKNVGIRRAEGEFVLCTNADIFFDPGIVRLIGQGKLLGDSFYRADRYDFKEFGDTGLGNRKAYLRNMKRNVFRYYVSGGEYTLQLPLPQGAVVAGLRLATRIRHYFEAKMGRRRADSLYHCHASGDFMLMHNSNWQRLRGYPENTLISTHTDSIMVFKAATLPLKQMVLPYAVYHQHHGRRYDFDGGMVDEDMAVMYARMHNAAFTMLKNGAPLIENGETWGLSDLDFEEQEL